MTEFGSLTIQFDPRVLRPRRWTTSQSAWAAELLRTAPEGPVLELCAGVGHIGLLAVRERSRPLVMVDASEIACEHAAANVERAGLASPVDIRCGRMDEVLGDDERFAFVIADPPWVRSNDTSTFPEDPLIAIDGGTDGLDLARTCLEVIGRHLLERGQAILQLGTREQAETMNAHLGDHPELGLHLAELRQFEDRGVLMRVTR